MTTSHEAAPAAEVRETPKQWGPVREIGVARQYDEGRKPLPTGAYVCLALYRGDNDDRFQFKISRGLAEALRNELTAALDGPQPWTYRNVPWSDDLEDAARTQYEGWTGQAGYVPWVPGGNSLKQDEARDIVMRAALARATQQGAGDVG